MRKCRLVLFIGLMSLFLAGMPSGIMAESLAVPPFPVDFTISMSALDPELGGVSKPSPCLLGSTSYGCTAFCNDYGRPHCEPDWPVVGYPYASSTIVPPIETYYLLDVVSQEMNPSIYNEPAALQAQAIATRSYLGWFLNNAPDNINNSSAYQVFIPYKFDSLNPTAAPLEPTALDPCASTGLNAAQHDACEAITRRYYIARSDVNLPAFAEFTGDALGRTVSHAQQSTRFHSNSRYR